MPQPAAISTDLEFGYLDTSLLVPVYCPEILTELAQQTVSRIAVPVISRLVEAEFASAFSRKIRTGEIAAVNANLAHSAFQRQIADGFYLVLGITDEVCLLARNWLAQFNTSLRTLDALHLATAHLNQCELITADRNLGAAAQTLGVKCRLVA